MTKIYTIGVVGNPNCGKTTLFNALTGAKQQVGNWPGVTVEQKTGHFGFASLDFKLVDLPGTYSLDVFDDAVSVDEQIARDYIASYEADLIVNIVDASNIERNLYLTSQLIEMKVPMLIALNMMDAAKDRGISVDVDALSSKLDCTIIPIVAAKQQGVENLKREIARVVVEPNTPSVNIPYDGELETGIKQLVPLAKSAVRQHTCDARWLALKILEQDNLALRLIDEAVIGQSEQLRHDVEQALGDDVDIAAADGRYTFVNGIVQSSVQKAAQLKRSTSDKIDQVVLNRVFGIPIFLLVMYLMFMLTINLGSAFIDFFDQFVGAFLVDGLGHLMTLSDTPGWLKFLIADGIGAGIQVVATFIPVIGFLYLFLSVLEDSGYMARAAFVMDRFMRFIGLPGKAFVPLLVGFGCNVPAIMATRTMEHQRDRVMTIMMNPFMSCGARLPVYALFAAAFFPVGGQNLVFGLYLIGIAAAVVTGLIMKNTVFKGDSTPFVMELPAYHLPTVKGVLLRTWDRLKTFLFRAGKVIVPMVVVLNFLNGLGTDGSFDNENSDRSILSEVGRTIAPVFAPMGLDKENWPATVGIFTGVLAKEVVVGTLDALYSQMGSNVDLPSDTGVVEPFDLSASLSEAFKTIPANLTKLTESLTDPLGLDIGDVSDTRVAADSQDVVAGTFAQMRERFDGQAGAFAYLLFILLYFPCVAATAAVYRETNLGWTVFVASWTTGLAYMAATVFYQIATFERHPSYSTAWILGLSAVFGLVVLLLKFYGRHRDNTDRDLIADI